MSEKVNKKDEVTAIDETKLKNYQNEYNEEDFWKKIKQYGKMAGSKVVYKALQLYYAAIDENTPLSAKAVIWGALGYFIFPVDILPDVIPVFGFTDDLAFLTAAIGISAVHITPKLKKKSKEKLKDWFGEVSDSELED